MKKIFLATLLPLAVACSTDSDFSEPVDQDLKKASQTVTEEVDYGNCMECIDKEEYFTHLEYYKSRDIHEGSFIIRNPHLGAGRFTYRELSNSQTSFTFTYNPTTGEAIPKNLVVSMTPFPSPFPSINGTASISITNKSIRYQKEGKAFYIEVYYTVKRTVRKPDSKGNLGASTTIIDEAYYAQRIALEDYIDLKTFIKK
ncbi:hypothetical protein HX004_03355 [Myroides sp. 1354]|uniref:hypothetical protein n=1 Tax=unclassified Myroides TaxID=2642485 RepID=UPI002575A840|nr:MULTISPECIES: hypothetical protein [unclassified Myroides]MDM1043883.1 hypothetical protein [Myroides sp. R163-1]MDM1054818.1 hypothetical protein [Myroides sp. 1354]MDM1068115.1 hypothetical protein [Myroides sp. 1372]